MSSTSSSNSEFFFGFDLLYKTIERSVIRKSDVLIALIHFVLMKHSNFRCLGIGEDKTLLSTEEGSELLPDGWNEDSEKYALRYKANENLYLLLGYSSETSFIINLLDVKSNKVSNISLDPENIVKTTKGNVYQLLCNASHIADRVRKELIDPVYGGYTREVMTQTNQPNNPGNPDRIADPLRITDPMQGRPGIGVGIGQPRPFGLPDYGASDLDPLGRVGQGNLFPFPSRPNFQGSMQPRFDPFGPPDRNVPPNPNPDHLQPPGFGGDYFS